MSKPLFRRKALNLTLAIFVTFGLAETAAAQAETSTTNRFLPFTEVALNPCANGGAGEHVLISGILHILEHETDHRDGSSRNLHLQTQGVSGIGVSTGDVYRRITLTSRHDNTHFAPGPGAQTFKLIEAFRLIGPGPDNDFVARFEVHITINANGELVVTRNTTSVDCR